MKFFKVIFFVFFSFGLNAQLLEWTDHLSYHETKKVVFANDKAFCITPQSIFCYTLSTSSVERINKINYLSDIGIADAEYSKKHQALLIGYVNGSIDVIKQNKTSNYQDIIRASAITNKTINSIFLTDSIAYICGGFGIILFDIAEEEIKENYRIGTSSNPVEANAITIKNDTMYSATNQGIYWCELSNNLIKFPQAWKKFNQLPRPNINYHQIFLFNNSLYVNYATEDFLADTLYRVDFNSYSAVSQLYENNNFSFVARNDSLIVAHNFNVTVYDRNFNALVTYFDYQTEKSPQPRFANFYKNFCWIADGSQGMIKSKDPFNNDVILPSSPEFFGNSDIVSVGNTTIVARGDRTQEWGRTLTEATLMVKNEGIWKTYNRESITALDTIKDIVNITVNPNNTNQLFGATLGFGLVEFDNFDVKDVYTTQNSTLVNVPGYGIGVSDVKFDNNGNVWCTNMFVNDVLHVKNTNGNWGSFSFPQYFTDPIPNNLVITSQNHKWLAISETGILVLDDNNTPLNKTDDRSVLLTTGQGAGNLPSPTVYAITEDKDGEIWIGTNSGLRVFYNPGGVFEGNEDAQDILIKQGLYFQILLETEAINAIAVDGADNKWIGTQNSGVFCVSPDGTEQLYHFTSENSPLWSNNIQSIDINSVTGEVMIGTNDGLIAFRGTETEPNRDFNNIYAYPNPVKPAHVGPVAITGLVRNTEVIITDTGGNIVYKTLSPGGQAIWDLKNQWGQRVASGVYLVFVSSLDGIQREVTKIMVTQ